MYIEFGLPTGSGGLVSSMGLQLLKEYLQIWSEKYSVPHKIKLVKHTVRVTFDEDRYYGLFSLTWNPGEELLEWMKFRLIDPAKTRQQ